MSARNPLTGRSPAGSTKTAPTTPRTRTRWCVHPQRAAAARRGEDLLADDVQRPRRGGSRLLGGQGVEGLAQPRLERRQRRSVGLLGGDLGEVSRACPQEEGALQVAEIPRRIPEAVGVVDAQGGDLALVEQLEEQPVGLGEDLRLLHVDRRQLVDVEEAAVVDLLRGHAPVRHAVGLLLEEPVEGVEAARLAGPPVDALTLAASAPAHRPVADQRRQRRLISLLAAALDALRAGLVRWACERAGADAHHSSTASSSGPSSADSRGAWARAHGVGARVHRQVFSSIEKKAAVVADAQLPVLEHRPVVIAEHRQEHAVGRPGDGLPVDVEERREERAGSVLQDVHPPGVVGADAHVVGHEVEEEPELVGVQRLGEGVEVGARADGRAEVVVVDQVVAVRAPGAGAEEGRGVQVADAQVAQVVAQRRRLVEGELGVELHAVRGARDARPAGEAGRCRLEDVRASAVCTSAPAAVVSASLRTRAHATTPSSAVTSRITPPSDRSSSRCCPPRCARGAAAARGARVTSTSQRSPHSMSGRTTPPAAGRRS